ncbi:GNAT family N-acetyltransferase [Pseudorhizobium pelagicum]|uniref:N-acetyltransferase domain-containing protein n=1 Tax=Pseudorhizobium pelagicum TaxID=1509405 RepID=A0A922P0D8_9HYPH|nr:GNAT family N-acetyltransferase [Pseudorhizobium pelagicum]KEQ02909.1 hypothetical protein GV67_16510 [Pseudorhizobium pelagicum]KEQ03074.1 hypothetical protein GV68_18045 [Pseudorhizobium pelagicum]
MPKSQIRLARDADVSAIKQIVGDAYSHYITRLGREPAPMTEDYAPLVESGNVWLLVVEDEIAGLIVLRIREDHLLLSNVAVATQFQGRGFGRQLLDYAERYAGEQGKDELRLYTNELMHENLRIYQKLCREEYDRAEQDGFRRVFMRKKLAAGANAK